MILDNWEGGYLQVESRLFQQGYGWSLGDKRDWPHPLVGIHTLPE